ncbi:MAG: GNAT family N-acetyltransferase [Bacteroidota bacterium]
MKQTYIRLATVEDAAVISLLARITFDQTFGHLFTDRQDLMDYFDRTFSVPKIESSLGRDSNLFWLAFHDQLPVGYAKLKLDSPTPFLPRDQVCQLQKIYVLKDFLSLKIGFQLQEILLQTAIDKGYTYTWLSVLHSNERAIRFYEKTGFSKLGTHGYSIGQEDFTFFAMGREINPSRASDGPN